MITSVMLSVPVELLCNILAKPWQDTIEDKKKQSPLGKGHYTMVQFLESKD